MRSMRESERTHYMLGEMYMLLHQEVVEIHYIAGSNKWYKETKIYAFVACALFPLGPSNIGHIFF